jgi:hypothetical protein
MAKTSFDAVDAVILVVVPDVDGASFASECESRL